MLMWLVQLISQAHSHALARAASANHHPHIFQRNEEVSKCQASSISLFLSPDTFIQCFSYKLNRKDIEKEV